MEEVDYFKRLPRDECLAFLHCNKPITLTTSRRIAHRTGIPLVDLLCGLSIETTRELQVDWRESLPPSLSPKVRRKRIDVKRVKSELNIALSLKDSPSLRAISENLKVSPGGLSYQFPDLCKQISRRYKLRLEQEKLEKSRKSREVIIDAIDTWKKQRLDNPTKKGLLKHLFPSSGLPKNVLRTEINKILS